MAKNSAINLDVTPRADGFSIAGGTASQELRISVADAHFIGQLDGSFTLPNSAATNLIGENYYTAAGAILQGSGVGTAAVLALGTAAQQLRVNGGATALEYFTPAASTSWTWVEETTTSRTLADHEAIVANNAALVTLTLPAVAALGAEFWVVGKGAGLFRVQTAAGDTIHLGSSSSTVSGYVEATQRRDAIRLVCTVANAEFTASVAPQGNFTVA